MCVPYSVTVKGILVRLINEMLKSNYSTIILTFTFRAYIVKLDFDLKVTMLEGKILKFGGLELKIPRFKTRYPTT